MKLSGALCSRAHLPDIVLFKSSKIANLKNHCMFVAVNFATVASLVECSARIVRPCQ